MAVEQKRPSRPARPPLPPLSLRLRSGVRLLVLAYVLVFGALGLGFSYAVLRLLGALQYPEFWALLGIMGCFAGAICGFIWGQFAAARRFRLQLWVVRRLTSG